MLMGMQLNDAQREIVERKEGPAYVVAPPGSGKTATLVERVWHLISKKNVRAERILALTFTTKAAEEMKERLTKRLPEASSLPLCATFHSLCFKLLQRHGGKIGHSEIRIIDPDVSKKEIQKLRDEGQIDFDDVLRLAHELLLGHADVADECRDAFDHILIDEYQDTNDVQNAIAHILAGKHRSICVIGDPNQAIYGFRGATAEHFLNFKDRYPDAARIDLSVNYRSTPLLIEAAHGVICHNPDNLTPKCPQAHEVHRGLPISLLSFANAREEAHHIVKTIESLIGGTYHPDASENPAEGLPAMPAHAGQAGGYEPGDIAVLYRLNALGKTLAQKLGEAGIPYVLVNEANLDEIQFDTYTVTLMTMHAAKGLEFPVVIMSGLEDGIIPYLEHGDDQKTIKEERRLFYVAMTRAKERLYLTYSRARMLFGKRFETPSRFIQEIPAELVKAQEMKRKVTVSSLQRKLF